MDEETLLKIHDLESFKERLGKWRDAVGAKPKAEHRPYIQRHKMEVRQEIVEAGYFEELTLSDVASIDPFELILDVGTAESVRDAAIEAVFDMVDQTIGYLRASTKIKTALAARSKADVVKRNYAFVAMAMDDSMHDLVDVLEAIKAGAQECGVNAERIDDPVTNDRITPRIWQSIREAEFVICDLTHARPNVFYEAGFADALGKTPIYIARVGTKLEFDVKDFPVIFFKNMKELREKLAGRLSTLTKGRGHV